VTGLQMLGNRAYNRAAFGGTQIYGIHLESDVAQFIVKDNDLTGNATGGLDNDAGTSSTKIVKDNLPDGLGTSVGALDDLTDVTITSATAQEQIHYNGSAWVNSTGHYEVIVDGTAPPVAVTNEAEDDWLYGWVES
jgi:hypothetical protein